jgi:hypothetical protein
VELLSHAGLVIVRMEPSLIGVPVSCLPAESLLALVLPPPPPPQPASATEAMTTAAPVRSALDVENLMVSTPWTEGARRLTL